MRMSKFSEEFFELLLEIQKDRPDLIASDIDVLEAFGMSRSARRGATLLQGHKRLIYPRISLTG
jgi:hypothetical protein